MHALTNVKFFFVLGGVRHGVRLCFHVNRYCSTITITEEEIKKQGGTHGAGIVMADNNSSQWNGRTDQSTAIKTNFFIQAALFLFHLQSTFNRKSKILSLSLLTGKSIELVPCLVCMLVQNTI